MERPSTTSEARRGPQPPRILWDPRRRALRSSTTSVLLPPRVSGSVPRSGSPILQDNPPPPRGVHL